MNNSVKTALMSGLVGLVIGGLVGYIPAHQDASSSQERNAALQSKYEEAQRGASEERNRLALSDFAVRASEAMTEAEANNYSVASGTASNLFTDLRGYVDHNPNTQAAHSLEEVLAVRDKTIAGLAQASPAVRPVLTQIFEKLVQVSDAAKRAR